MSAREAKVLMPTSGVTKASTALQDFIHSGLAFTIEIEQAPDSMDSGISKLHTLFKIKCAFFASVCGKLQVVFTS